MPKLNKKKEKKNIAQNFRNWFLNQNYKFNIKLIAKKILKQIIAIQHLFKEINKTNSKKLISLIKENINVLNSLFDKSLKRNIYHKNIINKKKSKLNQIINFLFKNI